MGWKFYADSKHHSSFLSFTEAQCNSLQSDVLILHAEMGRINNVYFVKLWSLNAFAYISLLSIFNHHLPKMKKHSFNQCVCLNIWEMQKHMSILFCCSLRTMLSVRSVHSMSPCWWQVKQCTSFVEFPICSSLNSKWYVCLYVWAPIQLIKIKSNTGNVWPLKYHLSTGKVRFI